MNNPVLYFDSCRVDSRSVSTVNLQEVDVLRKSTLGVVTPAKAGAQCYGHEKK
jgi:hypothetical protein